MDRLTDICTSRVAVATEKPFFLLDSIVQVVGNWKGSQAQFKEVFVDPSQFTATESSTTPSLNICALKCRFSRPIN